MNKRMEEKDRLQQITKPLIKWYQKEGRILPWREGKNPYHIWISEIMLQQTRIEAVKEYYKRFIQELPTVHDLANVEEQKLLKLWEGLGYYNRARNLKKAAQMIEQKQQGKMPKTAKELQDLPGIGEYTAGAISSIAYDEPVPAVDGNVLRVINRILASKKDVLEAETKKEITRKLTQIMPKEAGDFNEGLMELGELICLPKGNPLCEICPIQEYCLAKEKGLTDEIPVRIQKTKRKQEEKTIFVLIYQGKIAIQKRAETGLLAGMYEFPTIEKKLNEKQVKEQLMDWKVEGKSITKIGSHHHIFSHREWDMVGYQIECEEVNESSWIWARQEELEKVYPIPGPYTPFMKKIKLT